MQIGQLRDIVKKTIDFNCDLLTNKHMEGTQNGK